MEGVAVEVVEGVAVEGAAEEMESASGSDASTQRQEQCCYAGVPPILNGPSRCPALHLCAMCHHITSSTSSRQSSC